MEAGKGDNEATTDLVDAMTEAMTRMGEFFRTAQAPAQVDSCDKCFCFVDYSSVGQSPNAEESVHIDEVLALKGLLAP
ncbi:hypothetical protein GE061_019899 [Apolygus lucorum]|uniref:Uncharacterized protein n=1 Tax=Apolygus lucorum TaxID=248454 RepID=A0A8S9XCC8_APOLU|nr:hypothetical protein GE061_019899 [Apolygus lucorum]